MEQNNNEGKWVSDEQQKNRMALERPLDLEKLNDIIQEYFLTEWCYYVTDIDRFQSTTSLCMGVYYNNLNVYDEEFNCRILTPETDDLVPFRNIPKQNDDMDEYAVNNIKAELGERIKGVHMRESVFRDFYISPRRSEDSLAKEQLIQPYIVIWGIFENTKSDSAIDKVLKRVMLDCICESFGSWDELEKINQIGVREIKRLVELRKFDFMSDYRVRLFEALRLPDEMIIRDISFLPYENRMNIGKVIFMRWSEFDNLQGTIRLTGDAKVKFSDKEMVRKLLVACKNKYYLAVDEADDKQILGYVKIDDYKRDSVTRVIFEGEGKYKIFVGQEEALRFERAEYHIYKAKKHREINDTSDKMQEAHKQIILDWAKDITHGALFIFIKQGIEDQVARLCDQYRRGFHVDNISVRNIKDFMSGMADVDGAVLIDYEGNCHAYGVILDGEAKIKGNPQKGARFNSAVNYIFGEERTAVVISEDVEKPIYIIDGKELEQNPDLIFDGKIF